jgi:chaperonin cofactor prefoldin
MVGSDEKLWLLLDGVLKRLVGGKFWSTSADEWDDDLKNALESLRAAMKKIEKNIEKKS